jgi:F0F1-type ATP synthase assembly protein I
MADILSGLKNKVTYNIHKATYDPEAEKFAKVKADQDKKEKEEAQKKKEDEIQKEKATEAAQTPSQKAVRIGKTIAGKTLSYVTLSMGIFLSIIYAMIVANNLITEPWVIRLFAFIAVSLLSISNPLVFGALTLYFISFGIYNKTKGKTFLPPIFAVLPITTTPSIGTFSSLFKYPFLYPKGQESEKKLKEIMEKYKTDLKESFINFEGLSASYPVIKRTYDEFSKKLDNMNILKKVVDDTKDNISIISSKPIENKTEQVVIEPKPLSPPPEISNTVTIPVETKEI